MTSSSASVAHICEQWGMNLTAPAAGDETWFLDWVLQSPKNVSHHLTAGFHAYRSLAEVYSPDDIESAIEYFGGMGAQSLMIQEFFAPTKHVVGDYSAQAVSHLQTVLPEPVWAVQMDAYDEQERMAPNADIVGLDFGDMTCWGTRDGQKHRRLLDAVFGSHPKAVVLTDIAGPRLHLHRDRYEGLLGAGTCSSYETYLDALVARLEGLYDYELQAGFTHRWSTVMAFVPNGQATRTARQGVSGLPYIRPVPAQPVGLELL